MPELNQEHLRAVIDAINRGPFFRHLAMKVTELGPGHSVVEVEIGREHRNPFGGIHGGVYAATIDTAAYWSAYCHLPEDAGLITMDLKVDFLAPVLDRIVIVKGQLIHSGRTTCLAEGRMFAPDGKVLGHGTSKLMVKPGRQTMNDVVRYVGSGNLPAKFLPSPG